MNITKIAKRMKRTIKTIVNLPLSFYINLPHTLYFNFHYLPFKQAIKLPILLYKSKFVKVKGSIKISSDTIYFGMIKLGVHIVNVYANNGFSYENLGGSIEFKGSCTIGSSSFLSIGKNGKLIIGEHFIATTSLKIICWHYIKYGANTLIGWENIFMDTGFHRLKHSNTHKFVSKACGPIIIGDNNWFTTRIMVLKNTTTPDFCTIASNSILSKKVNEEPNIILAGSPAKVIAKGIYRDMLDDKEIYEEYNLNTNNI